MYGSCFCIHSVTLCLLIRAFSAFTFEEIIDMYVFIAILLIVLGLFLYFLFLSFSFALFPCDLIITSKLCLDFFLFVCMCIYYRPSDVGLWYQWILVPK